MSDFSLEPTGATPPPRSGAQPWKALTTALTVVVAVLVLLLLRAHGVIGSDQDLTAARMGSLSCSFLAGVDPEFVDGERADLVVSAEKLAAARTLAGLAAEEDSTYADLDETLHQILGEEVDFAEVIEQGHAACAELSDLRE